MIMMARGVRMSFYIMTSELSHYGVKGMRWGIRKEYSSSGSKKPRRGLTEKQKTYIKRGAVIAGTALALYGGYNLYKYIGNRPSSMLTYGVDAPLKSVINKYPTGDITLSSKTTLNRVSSDAFENLKGKGYTYVSYKFRDNNRYLSGFRSEINSSGLRDFIHKIKPKSNIKIASPRTVADEFYKLRPNASDQTFRLVTDPYVIRYADGDLVKSLNGMQTELFTSLKNKGYSGIIDIEDASKHKGSSPLIIFDPDNYLDVKKSRKIGYAETFVANILK